MAFASLLAIAQRALPWSMHTSMTSGYSAGASVPSALKISLILIIGHVTDGIRTISDNGHMTGMRVLVRLRNGVYNTAVIICNRACMIARLEAVMHMSSRETIRATYDALQRPRSPIAGFT